MRVIYKYKLPVEDIVRIQMPKGAEILSIREQTNDVQMWAMVENSNEAEQRVFEIIGTGHKISESEGISKKYVGTFHILQGSFVGHVFEHIKI